MQGAIRRSEEGFPTPLSIQEDFLEERTRLAFFFPLLASSSLSCLPRAASTTAGTSVLTKCDMMVKSRDSGAQLPGFEACL